MRLLVFSRSTNQLYSIWHIKLYGIHIQEPKEKTRTLASNIIQDRNIDNELNVSTEAQLSDEDYIITVQEVCEHDNRN